MKNIIKKKCNCIKLVLSDVDGVLTDGGMYYSKDGEFLKKFNTKDGMGIELLLDVGIKTILITREKSEVTISRGKKLKVEKTLSGIIDKKKELEKICVEYNVTPEEIAYIGDDVNDLEIMKLVGFSCSPNDGVNKIKKIADYICKLNGGKGVFREVSDLILEFKE
jgi:YrbI family 3-deoxy-D-manno-octulosonate 8-phosphate phosphatase